MRFNQGRVKMKNLAMRFVLAGLAVVGIAYGDGKDGGFATEMVFVEGGTFMMGCTVEQGGDCVGGEKPARSVAVGDFYIGKTEVTQGLWASVMGRNPFSQYSRYGVGDDYPVYFASWNDTQEFIRKLNEKTGKKYRLPTEAEWEYAARGGKKSRHYKYSGSDIVILF